MPRQCLGASSPRGRVCSAPLELLRKVNFNEVMAQTNITLLLLIFSWEFISLPVTSSSWWHMTNPLEKGPADQTPQSLLSWRRVINCDDYFLKWRLCSVLCLGIGVKLFLWERRLRAAAAAVETIAAPKAPPRNEQRQFPCDSKQRMSMWRCLRVLTLVQTLFSLLFFAHSPVYFVASVWLRPLFVFCSAS